MDKLSVILILLLLLGCKGDDSSCETSEFGCCSDGVTEAQGYENDGCPKGKPD